MNINYFTFGYSLCSSEVSNHIIGVRRGLYRRSEKLIHSYFWHKAARLFKKFFKKHVNNYFGGKAFRL